MYRKLFYLFAFVFVLNACKKDKDDKPTNPAPNPPVTADVQFDTSNHVLQQNRNTKIAMGPSEIDYQKFNNGDVPGLAFNTYKTLTGFNWSPSGSNGEYYIIRTSRNTLYKFRISDYDTNPFITSVTFKPLK